jgi:hypothetical protein
MAVELAKTVLCDRPETRPNRGEVRRLPTGFPLKLACGQCESCRAISGAPGGNLGGNHPDLHVITKELIRYHDITG